MTKSRTTPASPGAAGRRLPPRRVGDDPHAGDREGRRRPGDLAGAPYASCRAGCGSSPSRWPVPARPASACGSASARATRPRPCTAARTSSSTCCSRAPGAVGAGHLDRARRGRRGVQRLHRQGVHLLPRPGARRGPAACGRRARRHGHQLGDHRRGRRGRARRDPRRDRHARRRPRRRRAQPVRRAGVGERLAARPPDRRHRRLDRVADPRPRSGASTGGTTAPPTSWSPWPATSTTPTSYAGCARVRPQRLPGRRREAGAARAATRGCRSTPAAVQATRPLRAGQPGARHEGHAADRRPPVRPRRAQHRSRRRHLQPAVPGGARAPRPGLLRVLLRDPPRRLRPGRGLRRLPAGQARRGAETVRIELSRVAAHGITEEELTAARVSCAAVWCSGSRTPAADVAARQGRAGPRRAARHRRGDRPIDAVTLDDVHEVAAESSARPRSSRSSDRASSKREARTRDGRIEINRRQKAGQSTSCDRYLFA